MAATIPASERSYGFRSSPGAGTGVFATRPLKPGQVIITDKPVLKLQRGKSDVAPSAVHAAYSALTPYEQVIYMGLHEGSIQYDSKVMRIFKANAFSYEGYAMVFLELSRVNHSCVFNAEVCELDDPTGEGAKLVAVREIAEGEEVVISYVGLMEDGSRAVRRRFCEEAYGFTCRCAKCMLEGEQAEVSDLRRTVYAGMAFKRAGMEISRQQTLPPSQAGAAGQARPPVLGQVRYALKHPLTHQEKVVYGFWTAKLLEAEGFNSMQISHAYVEAAMALHKQFVLLNPIVIIPAAQNVFRWMLRAISAMREVRDAESQDLQDLEGFWEKFQGASGSLLLVKSFIASMGSGIHAKIASGECYALNADEGGAPMSRRECIELVREINRRGSTLPVEGMRSLRMDGPR